MSVQKILDSYMYPGVKNNQPSDQIVRFDEEIFLCHGLDKKVEWLILYFHGNGETVTDVERVIKSNSALQNSSIIAPEYRGYGCEGRESGERVRDILVASTKRFVAQYIGNKKLIVAGYSIGSGAASVFVNRYPELVSGLVLINPFSSISDLTRDRVPELMAKMLMYYSYDPFPVADLLKDINLPIFIVCGEKDKVILPYHSEKIFKNLNTKSKRMVVHPEMDHGLYPALIAEQILLPAVCFFVKNVN